MFFLENMRPSWLPPVEFQQFTSRLRTSLLLLFMAAGFLAGLTGIPSYGWLAIFMGLMLGAVAALVPILSSRLLVRSKIDWRKIETVETLGWSWPWTWLGSATGIVLGLIVGVAISWIDGRDGSSSGILWPLLAPVFLGGGIVLDRAVLRGEVKIRTTAGMGIKRSRQNGWIVGIAATGVTAMLAFLLLFLGDLAGLQLPWLATVPWIIGGSLFLGITSGLAYGGLAALQYNRLRAAFQQLGVIPEDYVHFLDYAAERSLLRKVGGGYTFMHALLLDYFSRNNQQDLTA